MKVVLADASTFGTDLDGASFFRGHDVTVYPLSTPEQLKERIADAEVLVVNKLKITEDVLCAAPKLKLVTEGATGFDNIDLAACERHGVAVTNVPAYSTASVVQITVAMVLSLVSRLAAYRETVHSGAYMAGTAPCVLSPVYHEIAGMTWGVVGYGNIGRGVAAVAKALGARVLVFKRTPVPDAECVDLPTLCEQSDILTLHCPLNDGTRSLIGKDCLDRMKDGVILVNAARGAVVDEAAVAEAVKNGKIGGYGCDVFSREPFAADHPYASLLGYENVILTPHMAWGAREARERCLRVCRENADAFFAGQRKNRVDGIRRDQP